MNDFTAWRPNMIPLRKTILLAAVLLCVTQVLAAFDDDPRISFSKVDEKYLLETNEGNEYEWDSALRRWVPVVGIASLFPLLVRGQCLARRAFDQYS